jgi:hypothetical protein
MRGLLTGLTDAARFRAQEAVGASSAIDPIEVADAQTYRRLGSTLRDLSPAQYRRSQQAAIRGFITNPLTRRMAELPRDFMIGEGVKPFAPDATVQDWLIDFWTDPINRMDALVDTMCVESELLGELVLPFFVDAGARARLTLIDPLLVARTIPDPGNARTIIGVELGGQAGAESLFVPTILGPGVDDAMILTKDAAQQRATWLTKLPATLQNIGFRGVFYVGLNRIAGMSRGLSEIATALDHIDRIDQNLFDMLERTGLLSAFVWKVTLQGAQLPDIAKWRDEHTEPPRPGTVQVSNEKETWEAVTPDLKQADFSVGFKTGRNYVVGNLGYSPAWMGDTESNRATAAEASDPALKTVTAKQTRFRHILVAILQQVTWEAVQGGKLPPTLVVGPTQQVRDTWRTVSVVMPEMSPKDVVRASGAFLQVSQAANQLVSSGIMSPELAARVIAQVTPHLGLEVDVAAEQERLKGQPLQEAIAFYQRAEARRQRRRDAKLAAAAAAG